MSLRARIVVAVLWIASLVGVATVVKAQNPWLMTPLPSPITLSGTDVGFRVEGQIDGKPEGVLVIRLNGQWVVPTTSQGPARLASR